jgi:hypothetical protein
MANNKLFKRTDKVNGKQVKYGPAADLGTGQRRELLSHYGSHGKGKTQKNPLTRLTQYRSDHDTYVKAATQTKRPLTEQEAEAKRTGANAPNASINHIIASGTLQNILNHETLRFNQGARDIPKKLTEHEQQRVRKALAQQVAAVARPMGYARAIVKERKGESGFDNKSARRDARREVMQDILTAYQGKNSKQVKQDLLKSLKDKKRKLDPITFTQKEQEVRFEAFKGVLKKTGDSPGNLRLGNNTANTKISTGLDLPLDSNGRPTARAVRLHQAHMTYAPDRLLTEERLFTKNQHGYKLSSSQQVDPTDKRKTRPGAGKEPSAKKRRKN